MTPSAGWRRTDHGVYRRAIVSGHRTAAGQHPQFRCPGPGAFGGAEPGTGRHGHQCLLPHRGRGQPPAAQGGGGAGQEPGGHHHHHRRPGAHLRRPDQAGAGRSLRPAAGVPPRVRRRHPGLLRQIRSGDDGKQSSAGLAARGLPHPRQSLGHRARLCLPQREQRCGDAPRPPSGVHPHVPGEGRSLAGSAEPGVYPVPYPAHLRAGGIPGGGQASEPDEPTAKPHPSPLCQGGRGGAAHHRPGGQ